jgi:hypothetical protein
MEELHGHLEDRAAALQAGGLEKEASMSETIERFGEAKEVGTALRDVHGRLSGPWPWRRCWCRCSNSSAGAMPWCPGASFGS